MNQVPYEIVGRHVNVFNHRSHMEILNVLLKMVLYSAR